MAIDVDVDMKLSRDRRELVASCPFCEVMTHAHGSPAGLYCDGRLEVTQMCHDLREITEENGTFIAWFEKGFN